METSGFHEVGNTNWSLAPLLTWLTVVASVDYSIYYIPRQLWMTGTWSPCPPQRRAAEGFTTNTQGKTLGASNSHGASAGHQELASEAG
ncbi:hypothetical protein PG996_011151 [Apiospora saccharicola]|uniref:Uncharacterized protein n=1 Tax=Apiospora saccharicola TaxID=335842 RepID=A0ABR1UH65_9PEZI